MGFEHHPWVGASRVGLVVLLVGHSISFPVLAEQGDKAECFDAYDRAQRLRKAGKLEASRDQLIACALDTCPELTRPDCIKWLREVEDAMPTIIIRARGEDGADLTDIRLWLDGVAWLKHLDGNAVPIDPGRHTLRFQHGQGPSVEQTLMIAQGEKNRIVTLRFESKARAKAAAAGSGGKPREPGSQTESASNTGPLVLGAFGLVSLGISAYFELKGINDRDHLFDTCAPRCPEDDVDHAYRELLIGDIAGAVGFASLTGAAIWLLATPSPRAEAPPSAGKSGGFVSYSGTF